MKAHQINAYVSNNNFGQEFTFTWQNNVKKTLNVFDGSNIAMSKAWLIIKNLE